ncbi:MAG: GNAT family protein [Clostridium sp.]|nr:GNAT family protein [Clostridium sp.]
MFINSLLKGKNIKLSALKDSDIEKICFWYEDAYSLRLFDFMPSYPYSKDHITNWIKDRQDSNDNYIFAIRDIHTDEFLGYADLNDISWNNRVGNLSIGLGAKNARGKGFGYEALSLLLQFGFHELNLHRIQLTVLAYNKPAIGLYEKAGFKKEGTFREFIQRDGEKYDMYLYGLLYEEWKKLNTTN